MPLKDLAITEEEAKKQEKQYTVPGNTNKYPYGLCLYLDNDTLDKLGLGQLPAIGSEVLITAKAIVTSISERQEVDNDKRRNIDLQLTSMEMDTNTQTNETEKANVLYGDSK